MGRKKKWKVVRLKGLWWKVFTFHCCQRASGRILACWDEKGALMTKIVIWKKAFLNSFYNPPPQKKFMRFFILTRFHFSFSHKWDYSSPLLILVSTRDIGEWEPGPAGWGQKKCSIRFQCFHLLKRSPMSGDRQRMEGDRAKVQEREVIGKKIRPGIFFIFFFFYFSVF